MSNALGAWLHCHQVDLHRNAEASHYSSVETPHELNEQEIQLVIERLADCEVLFPPEQQYVSWAVSHLPK